MNLHVATSPLTGNIYAGTVATSGIWKSKKEVTGMVCGAVAEHVLMQTDQTVIVSNNGKPVFEITVKKLKE